MTEQKNQASESRHLAILQKIKTLKGIENDYSMSEDLRDAAKKQIEKLFKQLGTITYEKFESLKDEEWQNETD